jgi:aspartate aminotransferase
MKLADRTRHIELSPTFRINATARRMAAEGIDVLDFSVGEPDFPTPASAKEAGKSAIQRNVTRYTANEGTEPLREAIAAKLALDNGLDYGPDQILVSPGAKASLYCAAMALFGPGDQVLVPQPYWVSYPEQLRLAEAEPVPFEAREANGFKISARELDAEIGTHTRGLILNYPNNPTGACYDASELEAIAKVVVEHDIVVIADEIYEKLLYDKRTFTSIASLGGDIAARTVVINGMSKAFAMTGWRLGYAAGPKKIIAAMAKVQSHTTSHPSSISQAAGLAALHEAGEDVAQMAAEFERRRNAIVALVGKLPGVTCVPPAGAFYVFPNVSGLFGRVIGGRMLKSGHDVAEALLETARVAVVPGEAFGSPQYIRISFSCSMERIEEGMKRIGEAIG